MLLSGHGREVLPDTGTPGWVCFIWRFESSGPRRQGRSVVFSLSYWLFEGHAAAPPQDGQVPPAFFKTFCAASRFESGTSFQGPPETDGGDRKSPFLVEFYCMKSRGAGPPPRMAGSPQGAPAAQASRPCHAAPAGSSSLPPAAAIPACREVRSGDVI